MPQARLCPGRRRRPRQTQAWQTCRRCGRAGCRDQRGQGVALETNEVRDRRKSGQRISGARVAESLPDGRRHRTRIPARLALPIFAEMLPGSRTDGISCQRTSVHRTDPMVPSTKAHASARGPAGGWFALRNPGLYDAFRRAFHIWLRERPAHTRRLAYDGIQLYATLAAILRPRHTRCLEAAIDRAEGIHRGQSTARFACGG